MFSIQPFGPQPANAREHEAIVVGMYRIEVFEMIPAFRDNVRKTNVLEGIGILVLIIGIGVLQIDHIQEEVVCLRFFLICFRL